MFVKGGKLPMKIKMPVFVMEIMLCACVPSFISMCAAVSRLRSEEVNACLCVLLLESFEE